MLNKTKNNQKKTKANNKMQALFIRQQLMMASFCSADTK